MPPTNAVADPKATPTETFAPTASGELDPSSKEARLLAAELPKGPLEWAKHLVKALEAVYVGSTTIRFLKDQIAKRFNDPLHNRKDASHEDRHLTSAEAIRAMEQRMMDMPNLMSDTTIYIAKQFAKTGTYTAPVPVAHPADLISALPKAKAPVRELPDLVKPEVEASESASVEIVGPKQVKGAAGRLAADIGT